MHTVMHIRHVIFSDMCTADVLCISYYSAPVKISVEYQQLQHYIFALYTEQHTIDVCNNAVMCVQVLYNAT